MNYKRCFYPGDVGLGYVRVVLVILLVGLVIWYHLLVLLGSTFSTSVVRPRTPGYGLGVDALQSTQDWDTADVSRSSLGRVASLSLSLGDLSQRLG